MSANDVKVNINVSDNGTTQKAIKSAEALKKTYDSAANSASRISSGGTPGSRAVSNQAFSNYDKMKGISGTTGASARDFAKESQGLGGLVRLYATYAANIFAVGAAFRALREAAGTEIITRGLEQMGTAGGRSLVGLSKEMVNLTNGAISLRDAMSSVAKASAAGLTNKQIQDLAIVANKASNALGVNMEDAISRLTRGVTKLEPELLDELGLFTKIGTATEKYALSIGKSTSSLSDFERRQAFANAVIEEGNQKYKDIEAAANPYDKLAASVSNFSTALLNLVNGPLGQVAGFLASNTTALSLGFAAIGAGILKMALPALGQWRSGLLKSAEDSAKASREIANNFETMLALKDAQKIDATVRPLIAKVNQDMSQVQTMMAGVMDARSKTLQYAMSGNAEAEKLDRLQLREIARRETILKTAQQVALAEKDPQVQQTLNARIAQDQQHLNSLKAANALTKAMVADQIAIAKAEEAAGTYAGTWSEKIGTAARKLLAARAETQAISKQILANVGTDTQTYGTAEAFKRLNDNIRSGVGIYDEMGTRVETLTKGLSGMAKGLTWAKGALLILTAAMSTALNVIAPWLQAIGLVLVAGKAFIDWQSNAAKQQENFDSAFSSSTSAIKTAADTLALYRDKRKDIFSTDAITAMTNSINGMVDSLWDANKAFKEWQRSANGFDKFKDWWSGTGFGPGVSANQQNLAKSIRDTIDSTVRTLQTSSGKSTENINIIAESIGLTGDDLINRTKAYTDAVNKLDDDTRTKLLLSLEKVSSYEKDTAQSVLAFKESVSQVNKVVTEIGNSTQLSSLEGKLGTELVTASIKLTNALQDPKKAFEELYKAASDPKLQAALGDTIKLPQVSAKALAEQTARVDDLTNKLKDWDKQNKRLLETQQNLARSSGQDPNKTPLALQRRGIAGELDTQTAKLAALQKQAAEFVTNQVGLVEKLALAGLGYMDKALKYQERMNAIELGKAKTGILAQAGAKTAEQEYNLAVQEINIQKELSLSNLNLQKAVVENTRQLADLTAIQAYMAAQEKSNSSDSSIAQDAKLVMQSLQPAYDMAIRSINKDMPWRSQPTGNEARLLNARRLEDQGLEKQRSAIISSANTKIAIADLTRQVAVNKENVTLAERQLAVNTQATEGLQNTLKLSGSLSVQNTAALIDQEKELAIRKLNEEYAKKILKLSQDYVNVRIGGGNKAREEELLADIQRENNLRASVEYQTSLTAESTKAGVIAKNQAEQQKLITDQLNLEFDKRGSLLENQTAGLELLKQLGVLTEEQLVQKSSEISQNTRALSFDKDRVKLATEYSNIATSINTATTEQGILQEAVANSTGEQQAAYQTLLDSKSLEIQKLQESGSLVLSNITQLYVSKEISDKIADKQSEIALIYAKQADLLDKINNVSEALTATFGDLGTNIGKALTSLIKFSNLDTSYAAKKKLIEDSEELSPEQKIEGIKKLEKEKKKSELETISSTLSASKKMFDEKSKAYKILNALETANNILILANQAKEVASTVASVAKNITTRIPGIFASFMEQLGPWGPPAAAAAIAAFLGSIFSSGGSKTPDFQMNAQQRQETQGTAMTYQASSTDRTVGELVQIRRGVVGDNSAKLDGIRKGLSIMEDSLDEGNLWAREMVYVMRDIAAGIAKAAGSVYTIQGASRGSAFGTLEGENSGLSSFANTVNKTLSVLTLGLGGVLDKLSGGLVSGVVGAIFGKTTVSASITDSGIKMSGTFRQLAGEMAGFTAQLYETQRVTKTTSYLFGAIKNSSTSYTTNYKTITADIQKVFQPVFQDTYRLMLLLGDATGKTNTQINDALDSMGNLGNRLTISTRGLSGQELEDAINSVISGILDDAASLILREYEQFSKLGEETIQTVVRLIDETSRINDQLNKANMSTYQEIGKLSAYSATVTTEILKLAGDMQNFISQNQFFIDNFLTDEEKLRDSRTKVSAEMARLGYASITTKEQFKFLVRGLNSTTAYGRETYQALMDIAPLFNEVATANEEAAQKAKDATDKINQNIVDMFEQFSKNLKQLRDSLVLGSQSILTPMQKYAQSKAIFESTYQKAVLGDRAAQDALSGSATAFLEASKTVNASSTQYIQDFNSVISKIDSAITLSDNMISDAQKQLTVSESQLETQQTQLAVLELIAANQPSTLTWASLAEGITSMISRIGGIFGFADGGLARGLSIVGENGPELVDFNSPGRVYTAEQTFGMFNGTSPANQELVNEIRNLRREVQELRKQQQQETGVLVSATFDSQKNTSKELTETIKSTSSTAAWSTKLQNSVALV